MSAPTARLTPIDQVQVVHFDLDEKGMANQEAVRMYFSGRFLEHTTAANRLVVDMSGVQSLDSSALGPLVVKLNAVKKAGGRMALTGIHAAALREIFTLTRFDKVFTITADRDAAVAACQG